MTKSSARPWFVYILRCAGGSLYTGITTDLTRRTRQHNDGTASRYTRSRRPVKLVYRERKRGQSSALKREAAIKKLTRRQKLALIGDGGKVNRASRERNPPYFFVTCSTQMPREKSSTFTAIRWVNRFTRSSPDVQIGRFRRV